MVVQKVRKQTLRDGAINTSKQTFFVPKSEN